MKRLLYGLVAVLAVVAIVLVVVVVTDDDDDAETGDTSSTTTEQTTSTTEASTTTTLDPSVAEQALFPDPAAPEQYTDPREAAIAFARQLLGFRSDLIASDFAQGDSRSGEVEIRAFDTGAPTTVLLRQLAEDGRWFVIGATTESIQLETPIAGALITSPQPIIGSGSAFEGHIDVTLYGDGVDQPIATGFVTGSGEATPGPFSEELEYVAPDAVTRGVLVLSAPSGDDGTTVAATAIRVRF